MFFSFSFFLSILFYILSPRLTWRDVQHIVVWTSNWEPLKHDQDWSLNGVGLHVNRKFGFGLLVAEKIVELAKPQAFKTVPEKTICRGQINQDRKYVKSPWVFPKKIPDVLDTFNLQQHNEIQVALYRRHKVLWNVPLNPAKRSNLFIQHGVGSTCLTV